jgi:hypothetical protein
MELGKLTRSGRTSPSESGVQPAAESEKAPATQRSPRARHAIGFEVPAGWEYDGWTLTERSGVPVLAISAESLGKLRNRLP